MPGGDAALAELDAVEALTRWVQASARRHDEPDVLAFAEGALLGLIELLLKRGDLPYAAVTHAAGSLLLRVHKNTADTLRRWRPTQRREFDDLRAEILASLHFRPSPAARAARAGLGVLDAAIVAAPHATATYLEELLDALRDIHGDDRAFEDLRADPTLARALTECFGGLLR